MYPSSVDQVPFGCLRVRTIRQLAALGIITLTGCSGNYVLPRCERPLTPEETVWVLDAAQIIGDVGEAWRPYQREILDLVRGRKICVGDIPEDSLAWAYWRPFPDLLILSPRFFSQPQVSQAEILLVEACHIRAQRIEFCHDDTLQAWQDQRWQQQLF